MKAFIITLKGHKLSEKLASECKEQASKFKINVETFDAIYGFDTRRHIEATGLVLGRTKRQKMNPGHIGNFFSHYYLWQKCLENDEPLLILEHDGYLIRSIPNDVCDNFTHVLKLDCENPYAADYDIKIRESMNRSVEYQHSITGLHKRKKLGWYTWGSYGYIIKPAGAQKLIFHVTANGYISTDNLIADGVLPVSICNPSLVRLHPLFENRENIQAYTTTSLEGMINYE